MRGLHLDLDSHQNMITYPVTKSSPLTVRQTGHKTFLPSAGLSPLAVVLSKLIRANCFLLLNRGATQAIKFAAFLYFYFAIIGKVLLHMINIKQGVLILTGIYSLCSVETK